MPLGLNRTDLNTTGINYLHGFKITLPHNFGNLVTWKPFPAYFGNPVLLPLDFGNVVNWRVEPYQYYGNLHFGNYIGYTPVPPSSVSGIELEDGSGLIVLENGDIILLEVQ